MKKSNANITNTNNLEDILPASKNIAWSIVVKEQIEINDLKSPFDDWYLKFRKTKFNKNIFMERLMSVIMLTLNIICSVYRCNTSIACLNWISYWLDSYFMMSNRDIHKRSKCALLKWSTGDSSYAVYDRNAVFDRFFFTPKWS